MIFSPFGVVMGAALAQRVEDPAKKSQIEVLGGVLGSSPMGLVLLATLAQQAGSTTTRTTSGSTTPTETQVPDVTDLGGADVADVLAARELKFAGSDFAISNEPIGTHISSRPPAGTIVALGTAVTVVDSGGLQVPDVVNLSLRDAIVKLNDFNPQVIVVEGSEPGDEDKVVKQDPAANTFLSAGDQVDLTIRTAG